MPSISLKVGNSKVKDKSDGDEEKVFPWESEDLTAIFSIKPVVFSKVRCPGKTPRLNKIAV